MEGAETTSRAAAHGAAEGTGLGTLPLILCAFGVFGTMIGTWHVLLPDLKAALSLSPGPLGTVLSVGMAAAVPALLIGGRAVDRWGVRAVIVAAGLALALVMVGVSLVGNTWTLIALLMVYFAAIGLYDIGINAAAVRLEQRQRRRVVPYCHAAFSGGAACGAICAGLLAAGVVSFRAVYVGIALLLCAALAWVWYGELPPADGISATETLPGADPRATRNAALWIAAGISALSFISEAAIENWSAVYLRATPGVPALLGASAVATFHLAMTIGRLSAAGIILRVRRLILLRIAGCLGAAGIALTLATTSPPLILGGFLLVGLAFSGIVPVAVSLAGDLLPGRSGQATSLVFTVSYTAVLFGPGLVGGLAELTSLRAALGTIVVTGGAITLLTLLPAARRDLDR
jgi:MFS family permease